MYFQALDDKDSCVGIYYEGRLRFDEADFPKTLRGFKTWKYSGSVKDDVEYLWFYTNGESLSECCPPELSQELKSKQTKMVAFKKAFQMMREAGWPSLNCDTKYGGQGLPLTIVGDGKQKRDYIHVSDVVNANILAADSNSVGKGDILNIGYSKDYSVNEIAKMFGGDTGKLPPRIEPKKALLDSEKASKLLGWKPEIKLQNWVKEYKKKLGINEENKRTRKKSKQSKSKV